MPPLEQADLIHKALWWVKDRVTRRGQVRVLATSRLEIRCRWTDKKRDVLRPDGSIVSVDATIATDRALGIGDMVWRGGLNDLPANGTTGTGTGTIDGELPPSNIMQVTVDEVASDLMGRNTRYQYGLRKWGNDLPVL